MCDRSQIYLNIDKISSHVKKSTLKIVAIALLHVQPTQHHQNEEFQISHPHEHIKNVSTLPLNMNDDQ
jgi:hypothetical protein